jgi:hypothetical protein
LALERQQQEAMERRQEDTERRQEDTERRQEDTADKIGLLYLTNMETRDE